MWRDSSILSNAGLKSSWSCAKCGWTYRMGRARRNRARRNLERRSLSIPASSLFSAGEKGKACFMRSEEHTSELQSRFDLVCRLLLEKKKNKKLIVLFNLELLQKRYAN